MAFDGLGYTRPLPPHGGAQAPPLHACAARACAASPPRTPRRPGLNAKPCLKYAECVSCAWSARASTAWSERVSCAPAPARARNLPDLRPGEPSAGVPPLREPHADAVPRPDLQGLRGDGKVVGMRVNQRVDPWAWAESQKLFLNKKRLARARAWDFTRSRTGIARAQRWRKRWGLKEGGGDRFESPEAAPRRTVPACARAVPCLCTCSTVSARAPAVPCLHCLRGTRGCVGEGGRENRPGWTRKSRLAQRGRCTRAQTRPALLLGVGGVFGVCRVNRERGGRQRQRLQQA